MYRQSEKYLLNSNISPTCPYNMANFGLLAAEIVLLVWGTPANFDGFRVLALLLHGILVVGVSKTAALNRGHHLYLAGRPSRWALAHILVSGWSTATDTIHTRNKLHRLKKINFTSLQSRWDVIYIDWVKRFNCLGFWPTNFDGI